MRVRAKLTMAALLGVAVAAPGAAQVAPSTNATALFISPMGEPFRGANAREQVRAWFSGADANRDGALSLAEMSGDAERFFQMLNANRDREIDPTELRHYEEHMAPEIRVGLGGLGISSGYARKRRSGLSQEFAKTGSAAQPLERDVVRRGAGLHGLLNIPNPVASTDLNLNRGISPEEFARAARERFVLLDSNRDGLVRFEELPSLPSRN